MQRINSVVELDAIIKTTPTVVYFCADWCGQCQKLTPELNKYKSEHKRLTFVKVNIDHFVALTNFHQIQSIPTLVLFEEGKEVRRISEFKSQTKLDKFFKE